jgi:cytochrome c biogenesis protein CcdA
VLRLVVTVVAIALPDCINPTLIGGQLFVATGQHPRRQTAAFALGAFTATFVFGLAIALGLGDVLLALVPNPGPTVKWSLVDAAGVVLVVGGALIWIRRRALTRAQPDWRRWHGPAALIGVGIAGVELLTAFPYFAAIAMIVSSGVSDAAKVLLLFNYCVVYSLPLITIAVVFAVLGERADRIVRPVGDWLFTHWPAIVGPLTAVIGLALVAVGTAQLL